MSVFKPRCIMGNVYYIDFCHFLGSTPRGIRRQHFREMSDTFGFSSQVDFAKAVVRSNDTERWEMLKRYYVTSNLVLSGLSNFTACEVKSEGRKESKSLKRAQRSLKRTQENRSHEMSKKAKRKPQNSDSIWIKPVGFR